MESMQGLQTKHEGGQNWYEESEKEPESLVSVANITERQLFRAPDHQYIILICNTSIAITFVAVGRIGLYD